MRTWLEKLCGLEAIHLDGGAPLALEWESAAPRWVVFAIACALLTGIAATYRPTARQAPRRLIPAILRALAFTVLMVLASQPALVLQRERIEHAEVALLVDVSASMAHADRSPDSANRKSRLTQAVDALCTRESAALGALASNNHVSLYAVGDRIQQLGWVQSPADLPNVREQLHALSAGAPATRLAAGLDELLGERSDARLAAVVVISDGQDQSRAHSQSVIEHAQARKTPIVVVPMGTAQEPANLELGALAVTGGANAGDLVAVRAQLTVRGVSAPCAVDAALIDEETGATLATARIPLDAGTRSADVELFALPARAGGLPLRIDVSPLENEHDIADNVARGVVQVRDEQLRVLYVEGYPRYEYRYLVNALLREPTIRLSCLLLSADEDFAQEGTDPIRRFPETAEELADFDVIVLGDVDPHAHWASPAQLQLLAEHIAQGGGFAVIAGERHVPREFRGTALEALLPVKLARANLLAEQTSSTGGYSPRMTPAGSDSTLLRWRPVAEENAALFHGLPALYWCAPTVGCRPGAEVLLEHPTAHAGDDPLPMLVVGRFGAGHTLFQATDDTWRWRRHRGELLHDSYWVRALRSLAAGRAAHGYDAIELRVEPAVARLGERVRVHALVRDSRLAAQLPHQLTLVLRDAHGQVQQECVLPPVDAAQTTTFAASLVPRSAGVFDLDLAEHPAEPDTGAAQRRLRVEPDDAEARHIAADHDYLRALAEATGGREIPLAELAEAFAAIEDRSRRTPDDLRETLWDTPLSMALIVLLLAAEWVARRWLGMP